jgi:hypothetical protein
VAGKQEATEKAQRPDPRAGKEVLLLWAILGEGGANDVSRSALHDKGMLPSDDKTARDGLEARGLIKVEKRTSRNEKGRLISGYWMSVTEAGQAWAEENLAAIPAKSQVAAPILQAWLSRLSTYMSVHGLSLEEVLSPRHRGSKKTGNTERGAQAPTPEPAPALDYATLRARIRQAYLAVTGDRINTRARLRDIREKLNDIDRAALDDALKRMQREQLASLYPLDNKTEITDADRNAAVYFGAEPRHILWIER